MTSAVPAGSGKTCGDCLWNVISFHAGGIGLWEAVSLAPGPSGDPLFEHGFHLCTGAIPNSPTLLPKAQCSAEGKLTSSKLCEQGDEDLARP